MCFRLLMECLFRGCSSVLSQARAWEVEAVSSLKCGAGLWYISERILSNNQIKIFFKTSKSNFIQTENKYTVYVQYIVLSCIFSGFCRYYYPNVRDQLVAKSILPLSKLCALVTMQRQHPSEAEMFSLPLFPRTDSSTGHQSKPSGMHAYACTHRQSNM